SAWKNISHKDRAGSGKSLAFNEENFDTNNFFSYRNNIYCILPDGQMFMMVPFEIPTIGYDLVTTEVTKKSVVSNSEGFPEHEALDKLFN
ncbi:MAG: hypothetical protein IJR59_06880, partial [Firmicutes bacterium]|nr:hypothetical protein [Bacillota bacterium]